MLVILDFIFIFALLFTIDIIDKITYLRDLNNIYIKSFFIKKWLGKNVSRAMKILKTKMIIKAF